MKEKTKELKPWLISQLRRISRRWPAIYNSKNKNKYYVEVDLELNKIIIPTLDIILPADEYLILKGAKSGKRVMYRCEQCKNFFFDKMWEKTLKGKWKKVSAVACDHISPIVPTAGWDSWDGFIDRLFNGETQLLCRECHKAKSKEENRERRQNKPEKIHRVSKKDNRRGRFT